MEFDSSLMLSQVPVCLYIKNLDGTYTWCNEYLLQLLNKKSINEVIGKNDRDLFSQEETQVFRMNDLKAISANRDIQAVESFFNGKETVMLLSHKKPFIDQSGKMIGIIGSSVNITAQHRTTDFLRKEKENVGYYLSNIAELSGGSIYWKNSNGVYLGCNTFAAQMIKIQDPDDIVGKTDYDLFSKEEADIFRENDLLVMRDKKESIREETVLSLSGEKLVQLSFKRPIYDKQNNVVGVVGNTIDITAHKEAEQLRLETELQKVKAKEQETFKEIAGNVSHDIRSPIQSLNNMVKSCEGISEPNRIALRNVAIRINDIANNLLNSYKKFESEESTKPQKPQPVLVLLALSEIVSAKRCKYEKLPVELSLIHI